jgi:cytochrome c oxidase subunit I+III
MLAVIPFDWQVHDTYFVVAHLHYVLIGGMMFPLFAGLYYWAPLVGGRPLSERMGRWGCGLMFAGLNVAFLPMHLTGLLGMPRRVHTYAEGLGWDGLNLVSTVGAFLLAAGVFVVLLDVLLHLRVAGKVDANVWGAGTLEWLPADNYGLRSIPRVESREPLWDHPELAREVNSGQHYLPGTATGQRETIVTSPIDARPQYLLVLSSWSLLPLAAGAGTAAFFIFLTVKMPIPAAIGGIVALVAIFRWLWETDRGMTHPPVDIGGGIRLPVYASGAVSHSWWAMVVLMLVDATVFASLAFSYFFLASVNGGAWPPAGMALPERIWAAGAAGAWLAGGAGFLWAGRLLDSGRPAGARWRGVVLGGFLFLLAAFAIDFLAWSGTGVQSDGHAYGAVVHAVMAWQGLHVCVVLLMTGYTLARAWSARLDATRRVTFDNTRLFSYYTAAQGVAGVVLLHLT